MIHDRTLGSAHVVLDDDEGTPFTVTVNGPDGLTRTASYAIRPEAHVAFDALNTEEKALQWAREAN